MARFLVTCWPFVGHLYPQISVALALRARGHEVAFYTHESARDTLEAQGFRLFPFAHVHASRYELIHQLEAEVPATQPMRKNLSVAMRAYRDMLAASIPEQVADLRPIIRAWQPQALITDPALWGPILVIWELEQIPVVLLTQMIGSMISGPEAPPWGPGLAPPRTAMTRFLAKSLKVAVDLVAYRMRRQVNRIRAGYKLGPMFQSVNEHTGRLPLYLIPSVPELDYQRTDQPDNVHYVGPCVWTRPGRTELPTWLHELPADRPWVHVTEGTAHYQEPFLLRAAVRGLADCPIEIILTTGAETRDPETLGLAPLPPNVHVCRWISHEALLPRCAAIVTTGGAATVLAALTAGIPLLVVPTFWDKNDNAQRVVEAGVGLRLAPRRCSPEALRSQLLRLLEEPQFRRNAQGMAERFKAAPGPVGVAQLLERLLSSANTSVRQPAWVACSNN